MKTSHVNTIRNGVLALAASFILTSCIIEKRESGVTLSDYGEQVSVAYPVSSFTQIEGAGALNIKYTQGPTDSVRISGPSKWVENIAVTQDGELLKIGPRQNIKWVGDKPDIEVYLSSEDLSHVELSGANDFEMSSPVRVKSLGLELSGAADVEIKDLDVIEDFRIEVSGAGDVDVDKVDARNVYVELSGAGDVDVDARNAETVKLELSGAAAANLDLTDCGDVACEVSGAAVIELSGKANKLTIDKSGAASVDYGALEVATVEKR